MKKGFTLIELLAVIVILGILALILIPVINNVIEKSRMSAFRESVNNIISSGSNFVGDYLINNSTEQLPYPMVFTCDGTVCKTSNDETLKFTGEIPISGTITLKSEDLIYAEYVTNGKYCATGYKGRLNVGTTCADVDATRPIILGALDGRTLKLTLIDNESGIAGYCVTTTNDASTCSWINTTDNYAEYELTSPGTYYAFAKDKKENVSEAKEFIASSDNFCSIDRNTVFEFLNAGAVSSQEIPCDGLYKLEVYGASSGGFGDRAALARGGKAIRYVELKRGDIVYVAVGTRGVGTTIDTGPSPATVYGTNTPGWNGGGSGCATGYGISNGYYRWWGTGGGATHMALNSNRGELKNYKNNRDEILVVAGGAGGSAGADGTSVSNNGGPWYLKGGDGGGLTGGSGAFAFSTYYFVNATQDSGYAFGQGQNGSEKCYNGVVPGGGGGWYGGYSQAFTTNGYSEVTGWGSAAGGGSSYIGTSGYTFNETLYTNSTNAGVNEGNGKAYIELIDY